MKCLHEKKKIIIHPLYENAPEIKIYLINSKINFYYSSDIYVCAVCSFITLMNDKIRLK